MKSKNTETTMQMLDNIAEEIKSTPKKKKRATSKKDQKTKPSHIELNSERFEEERGRVVRYLENISKHSMGTFEAISILEDLGVIINTHELPKDVVLQQLRQALNPLNKEV